METKRIIPYICVKNGKAFDIVTMKECGEPVEIANYFCINGADEIAIVDMSPKSQNRLKNYIDVIKQISTQVDIPIIAMGGITTLEDIKKILYAGANKISINTTALDKPQLIKEASERFGSSKIVVSIDIETAVSNLFTVVRNSGHKNTDKDAVEWAKKVEELGAGEIILRSVDMDEDSSGFDIKATKAIASAVSIPIIAASTSADRHDIYEVLSGCNVVGAMANAIFVNKKETIPNIKMFLKDKGISVHTLESSVKFSEFKLDENGLIPVVVQDYKTNEVLMLAYMNEQAFDKTLETGRMTYYSRSKQAQWIKGETSGNCQFLKSLEIDCDKDTILAKVAQIGNACHTGNETCFYTNLAKKSYIVENPLLVLNEIYNVISDRKVHPKEGSYTNYLFEKGIDKILKKIGEEATEMVIAAKNPNTDELKYEISDFLYHTMVLMCEQGISWDDIVKELGNR